MFKGLSGLKKVVKGGISAVAEHSSDLAEKVISDPSTSQGHLKENLKQKVKGVVTTSEQISADTHAKETADEVGKVINKVRHYGALGEDYLGYQDPTDGLRKAVKEKQKRAKKALKAKKKKTGKKDDLFDPENLAKFKAELEERKKREAEFLQAQAAAGADGGSESDYDKSGAHQQPGESEEGEQEVKFTLDLAGPDSNATSKANSAVPTPLRSPISPVKEKSDDWKFFQSLTSGVDDLIKQKKEELEGIKQDSYFQRKPVQGDSSSSESQTPGDPEAPGKKKKWVDLDKAGFDDIDGSVSGTDSENDDSEAKEAKRKARKERKSKEKEEAKESEEEDKSEGLGLVEIPEDEDFSDEEDIFNTGIVDAVIAGDVKLAVIPDDPVYDDDPFNTAYAEEIVQKDKVEKRKEANRIKFTGLSSVADVLSGKAEKVDKSLIEHSTKRKRRRANRINLIGEDQNELTAREDIGGVDLSANPDQPDILLTEDKATESEDKQQVLLLDPLSQAEPEKVKNKEEDKGLVDLSEFEVLETSDKKTELTSNVAILAGEFAAPVIEEEDDFDAAFDALAQESVTRSKLEELDKQFEDTDVFDTTCADTVLNLASLTNKVEVIEEPLETFEDKDPFDTSAYEDITGDLETDLDFDSLAKRDTDPAEFKTVKKADIDDEFGGWNEVKPIVDQGWEAFKEKKPDRPPPPRPAPPRPTRAPLVSSKTHLTPKDAPSVVIKAPSTESIKSWNCATADILIRKSEIEALDQLDVIEDEEDPFDTSNFKDIVGEEDQDDKEDPFDTSNIDIPKQEEEDIKEEDIEDPFDTSGFKSPEPEEKPDLLTNDDLVEGEEVSLTPAIAPDAAPEKDPFDTEFASGVLPDKGDPFDTSYVKGVPGKAEIKALEEEFLTQEEFNPRTESEGSSKRKVAPGSAGRARPKAGGQQALGKVKLPEPSEEDDEDPFDTTIVDKVIPVRKAAKSSDLSVEDENFDPTSTFTSCIEEVDPFDTTIAGQVIPELADKPPTPEPVEQVQEEPEPEVKTPSPPPPPPVEEKAPEQPVVAPVKQKPVDEIAKKIGRARPRKPLPRQLTDEEFDPRA